MAGHFDIISDQGVDQEADHLMVLLGTCGDHADYVGHLQAR